jgi:hypothetical protein
VVVPTESRRRELRFADLAEAVRYAEALRSGHYVQAGRWDLAQVCGHLAEWLSFPLDGFPRLPVGLRLLLRLLRHTIGRRELRRLLATGRMPAGRPTLRETVPPPGGDEAAAVERLARAVARFEAHTGPLHPAPLFGELSREQWRQLQLIHCGHHLGFLRAASAATPPGERTAESGAAPDPAVCRRSVRPRPCP